MSRVFASVWPEVEKMVKGLAIPARRPWQGPKAGFTIDVALPMPAEEELLASWQPLGLQYPENLYGFPAPNKIFRSDMEALLQPGGWLTNVVVDGYLATLMPALSPDLPAVSGARVFIPSYMIARMNGGNLSGSPALDALRGILVQCSEIWHAYNIKNTHWVLMRLRCQLSLLEAA